MRSEIADFHERDRNAKFASQCAEAFLRSCARVKRIENVEDSSEYQIQDIDLLCTLEFGGDEQTIAIEIKFDTKAHQTRNFFFETVSNEALGTQGCFLKLQADLLFYCRLKTEHLYVFTMKEFQEWFLRMRQRMISRSPAQYEKAFPLRHTHTRDAYGRYKHTTIGRCVGIEYTKRSLRAENICVREIEKMNKWQCMLNGSCYRDNDFPFCFVYVVEVEAMSNVPG
jgi:hypothetical protein